MSLTTFTLVDHIKQKETNHLLRVRPTEIVSWHSNMRQTSTDLISYSIYIKPFFNTSHEVFSL